MDIEKAKEDKTKHGKLADSKAGKPLKSEELLALEVDVLALAALENQIHCDNVDEVQAGAILEIANGPLTSDADHSLAQRDVPILPDVLANTGGVIVSYFEWLQNRAGEKWSEAQVNERLDVLLGEEASKVLKRAEADDVTYRQAAYRQGIERIAEAIMARGNCQDCR